MIVFLHQQNQTVLKKVAHRSFILLYLLFCFYFVANAQKLVLQNISVDTIFPQRITLTWQPLSVDTVITILKYGLDENGRDGFWTKDDVAMNAMKWEDMDNISLNYYCITSLNSDGMSLPVNNMLLKIDSSENKCLNAVMLHWNPYINMLDTIEYYYILSRTIVDKDTSSFTKCDSIKGIHYSGTFLDEEKYHFEQIKKVSRYVPYLENNTTYQFVIQAIGKTKTIVPFSNIVEFRTDEERKDSVPVTISCVNVVDDNYIEVNVTTEDAPGIHLQELYLFRSFFEDFTEFDTVDSKSYNANNARFYLLTDKDVDPKSGLYYYKAEATYPCKRSDESNIVTNIYLTVDREESYQDKISFSQKGVNPPESYELLRIVNNNKIPFTPPIMITLPDSSCSVDVLPFMDAGAEVKYIIRDKNNCYSNTDFIVHEPYIVFPNAFYPSDQNLENQTFYPIIPFPSKFSEDKYLFIIYNRWGQEVFRATQPPVYESYSDKESRWDGTFQGKACPAGIYAYKLTYSFNKGSGSYSKTGSFMLIR